MSKPPRTFAVTPGALARALAGPDAWSQMHGPERKTAVSRARLALVTAERTTP